MPTNYTNRSALLKRITLFLDFPSSVTRYSLLFLLMALVVSPIYSELAAQDYKALREQLKQRQQNTRNEIEDLKARIEQAELDYS